MLLDSVTQDMLNQALELPFRGLQWYPENGHYVYRKFDNVYKLTKLRDVYNLETDSYVVDTESMSLFDLTDKCVWMPSPDEIDDLALASGFTFESLTVSQPDPKMWVAVYSSGGVLFLAEGLNPWEAKFNFLYKYVASTCPY